MVENSLEISLSDFALLYRQAGVSTILDVREAWEITLAAFKDSIHIPLGDLGEKMDDISKDDKIVTVCHHGVRSLQACVFLRESGFKDVVSLRGGIDAWARRPGSNVPTY